MRVKNNNFDEQSFSIENKNISLESINIKDNEVKKLSNDFDNLNKGEESNQDLVVKKNDIDKKVKIFYGLNNFNTEKLSSMTVIDGDYSKLYNKGISYEKIGSLEMYGYGSKEYIQAEELVISNLDEKNFMSFGSLAKSDKTEKVTLEAIKIFGIKDLLPFITTDIYTDKVILSCLDKLNELGISGYQDQINLIKKLDHNFFYKYSDFLSFLPKIFFKDVELYISFVNISIGNLKYVPKEMLSKEFIEKINNIDMSDKCIEFLIKNIEFDKFIYLSLNNNSDILPILEKYTDVFNIIKTVDYIKDKNFFVSKITNIYKLNKQIEKFKFLSENEYINNIKDPSLLLNLINDCSIDISIIIDLIDFTYNHKNEKLITLIKTKFSSSSSMRILKKFKSSYKIFLNSYDNNFSDIKDGSEAKKLDNIIKKIYIDFPDYSFKINNIIYGINEEYTKRDLSLEGNIEDLNDIYKIFSYIKKSKKIENKSDFIDSIIGIGSYTIGDFEKVGDYDFCKNGNDMLRVLNGDFFIEEIDELLAIKLDDTKNIVEYIKNISIDSDECLLFLSDYLPDYFNIYVESLEEKGDISSNIFKNIGYFTTLLGDGVNDILPLLDDFGKITNINKKGEFLEKIMKGEKYPDIFSKDIIKFELFVSIITILYYVNMDGYTQNYSYLDMFSKKSESIIDLEIKKIKDELIEDLEIKENIKDKVFNDISLPDYKLYKSFNNNNNNNDNKKIINANNYLIDVKKILNNNIRFTVNSSNQELSSENNIENQETNSNGVKKAISQATSGPEVSSSVSSIFTSNLDKFTVDSETGELSISEPIQFGEKGTIELSDDGKTYVLKGYGYDIRSDDKSMDSFSEIVKKTDSLAFLETSGIYALGSDIETVFHCISHTNAAEEISIEHGYLSKADKKLLLKTLSENMNLGNYDQNNIDKDLIFMGSSGLLSAEKAFEQTSWYEGGIFRKETFIKQIKQNRDKAKS